MSTLYSDFLNYLKIAFVAYFFPPVQDPFEVYTSYVVVCTLLV